MLFGLKVSVCGGGGGVVVEVEGSMGGKGGCYWFRVEGPLSLKYNVRSQSGCGIPAAETC